MAQRVPDGSNQAVKMEPCTEDQALEALQSLDKMRTELTRLRATIPSLIAPFLRVKEKRAPESLYKDFAKSATSAVENITAFRVQYEKNRPLLDRATLMRRERPDPKMPRFGVLERLEFKKDSPQQTDPPTPEPRSAIESEKSDESELEDDPRPAQEIIDEFKKSHPAIKLDLWEDDHVLRMTLPRPSSILISIQLASDTKSKDPKAPPRVISITPTTNGEHGLHLHQSMVQAIAARPHPRNLKLLLEMLATYEELFTTKCEICEHLITGKAEVPYVRRKVALKRKANELEDSKDSKDAKPAESRKVAKVGKQWRAFHESCWNSQEGS